MQISESLPYSVSIKLVEGFMGNMEYSQNHWVLGLCPSSGIIETRKQRFGKWICFRPQVRGKDTYSVGSLRKSVAISAYVYQFALF
jgi:hypothetical protein